MEKQKKQAGQRKRGTLSWVMEFAGRKRSYFGGSVLLAVLGVAASFLPYLLMADVVGKLIAGTKDWAWYLRQAILMGVCWIARVALHSASTTLSHVATFTVLGGIRKQLAAKLSRIPLGSVLDDHSGTYKNIIVERVDAMEKTMAHIIRLSTEFGGQDRRTDSVSCSRVLPVSSVFTRFLRPRRSESDASGHSCRPGRQAPRGCRFP